MTILAEKLQHQSFKKLCKDTAPQVVGLLHESTCAREEDFKREYLDTCTVEVLDGNHSITAQKAAYAQTNNDAFRTRLVALYAGLTDEQALSLGVSRNNDACRVHEMTSLEELKLFRRELYAFNKAGQDQEPPRVTPKYIARMKNILGIHEVRFIYNYSKSYLFKLFSLHYFRYS